MVLEVLAFSKVPRNRWRRTGVNTVRFLHDVYAVDVYAGTLVFLMHLGFATLESGLCQQKNVVNVLFKNVFIISRYSHIHTNRVQYALSSRGLVWWNRGMAETWKSAEHS